MPVQYHLTLITPSISQRELEGVFTWIHSIMGPSVHEGVQPVVDPAIGPNEALRVDFQFLWSEASALNGLRLNFYQSIRGAKPTVPHPIYSASLVTQSAKLAAKKLFVFDMDSTFINQEVIDELGRELGLYDEFARITESAMQGKIDFVQALHDRVALLKGLPMTRAHATIERLTLSPGLETLLAVIKTHEAQTMIVSGGFDFVLSHFQKKFGIDSIHAHTLAQDSRGNLEGHVQLPVVDGLKKRDLVAAKIKTLGLTSDKVVIIGDGANDIPMMSEAATQVAFQGKEKLNLVTNTWILERDYRWLIALL